MRRATPRSTGCSGIMVSAWWIVWAFVIGGYAGMLLIALVVIARRAQALDSMLEKLFP